MKAIYQHTQSASGVTAVLAIGGVVLVSVVFLLPDHPATSIGRIIATAVVLVLWACAAVFNRMTITVDRERLQWCFGFGLLRKAVPVRAIEQVERTRSRPVEGWGIHWTPRGWLYNVSGLDTVLVQLREGGSFLLGTSEPDQLVRAIQHARSHAPA